VCNWRLKPRFGVFRVIYLKISFLIGTFPKSAFFKSNSTYLRAYHYVMNLKFFWIKSRKICLQDDFFRLDFCEDFLNCLQVPICRARSFRAAGEILFCRRLGKTQPKQHVDRPKGPTPTPLDEWVPVLVSAFIFFSRPCAKNIFTGRRE